MKMMNRMNMNMNMMMMNMNMMLNMMMLMVIITLVMVMVMVIVMMMMRRRRRRRMLMIVTNTILICYYHSLNISSRRRRALKSDRNNAPYSCLTAAPLKRQEFGLETHQLMGEGGGGGEWRMSESPASKRSQHHLPLKKVNLIWFDKLIIGWQRSFFFI